MDSDTITVAQSVDHLPEYMLEDAHLFTALSIRNTFCGTWYLLHSQVHNDRTVHIIMADAMRMHKTAILPLPI